MTEFESLQSAQGLWDGLHRMWGTPTAPCERSKSQALVLASTTQVAVVVALRWRAHGAAFDAVLMLRSASGSSSKFDGRLCGTHPQLPVAVTLRGDSAERHGILLHGEENGRPWEVTVGRSRQEIALTVYDGAGCRPELPVMHATYPMRIDSLAVATPSAVRGASRRLGADPGR